MTTIVEVTQTSIMVQEQAIQSTEFSGGSSLPILGVIIIVIIGAVAACLVLHGRKKVTTSGRICEKCNAELPLNAKFCKKCGATVDLAN